MNDKTDTLWQTICAEVRDSARDEPVLASYFYTAVLSHDSLETALSNNLAQLLGNSVVSALVIRQLFVEAMAADRTISINMRRDLLAHYERDPACEKYSMPLLYFKGFHAVQVYRVAHWLWQHQRRELARYLQNQMSEIFAVDIHPGATIGGGLMVDHATGVVIGETTIIEDDVSILHSVTLGGSGCGVGARHPTIRRGVLISVGAKILGNIEVGAGAKVGAGSLVLESVAPHTTVAGVPARVVGTPREAQPALVMDQHINGDEEKRVS